MVTIIRRGVPIFKICMTGIVRFLLKWKNARMILVIDSRGEMDEEEVVEMKKM